MGLKNYTTGISVEKTILEIEQILSKHSATDIWKQFDGVGNVVCVNFAVNTEFGKVEKLFFRLMWLKDSARIRKGGTPKYFKHENEMSPEEYAWFKSDVED